MQQVFIFFIEYLCEVMIRQLQPTEQVYQLDRLFNQLNSVERNKLISLIEQIIEWKNSGKNYRTFIE